MTHRDAQSRQRFCKAFPLPSKGSPEPIVALAFDFTKEEQVASNGERRFLASSRRVRRGKIDHTGGREKHAYFLKLARDGLQGGVLAGEASEDFNWCASVH